MASDYIFPDDLDTLKSRVLKAIEPITEINDKTSPEDKFLFTAQRTNAGQSLPEYYLCYFLFVNLLGFKNLGKFEKISWSVPIDYKGVVFLIEHRKMELGLFAHSAESQEKDAKEIVKKIHKAVIVARPYFEWEAKEAAKHSKLNVKNYHRRLFDKLEYIVKSR